MQTREIISTFLGHSTKQLISEFAKQTVPCNDAQNTKTVEHIDNN